MVDMTDQSSAGPSAWQRDLFAHLTSHVEAESGLLEQYSVVAQQTQSNAFRYLVNLLIEEEIRHHRIFTELADSLKTEASLSGEEPIVPYMDFYRADRVALLEGTKQLMENERKDARELKRLQRELRLVKDTTLWGLLVDLMQRDTQKHMAILRFVRNHTRSTP
jgi:rubrerythrin